MFECRSGDGLNGTPEPYIYKPGEIQVFTFTTPISFILIGHLEQDKHLNYKLVQGS
jgi:hypothetical protein